MGKLHGPPTLSSFAKLEGAPAHGEQVLVQGPRDDPLTLETVGPPGAGMQGEGEGPGGIGSDAEGLEGGSNNLEGLEEDGGDPADLAGASDEDKELEDAGGTGELLETGEVAGPKVLGEDLAEYVVRPSAR